MLKRIPLHQLRIGMYIAGIDGSWLRTPFLTHRFLVQTVEQIERLQRSNVQAVDIDPSKGLDVTPAPIAEELLHSNSLYPSTQTPTAPDAPRSSVPITDIALRAIRPLTSIQASPASDAPRSPNTLNLELAIAQETRDRLVRSVKIAFDRIRETGVISPEPIHETVQEVILVTRTRSTHSLFRAVSQERSFDPSLSDHSLTVCMLAMIMGRALGYGPIQLSELGSGALLHDVGHLQLPLQLLHSSAPLSGKDLGAFRLHPQIGSIMIEAQAEFPQAVCRIAAEHHVTPDGRGYPPDISADSIAEASRIAMIADRYDELRNEFGGLRPLSSHKAIQQLFQDGELGRLDLRLVSLFISLVGIYPVYSFVELNTKERGMITTINPATLHQPIVALIYDETGSPYGNPLTVDLSEPNQPLTRSIKCVIPSESWGASRAA